MNSQSRMCGLTKRPIRASDKSSVQLLMAQVDENGRMIDQIDIVDICGAVRESGEVDARLYQIYKN